MPNNFCVLSNHRKNFVFLQVGFQKLGYEKRKYEESYVLEGLLGKKTISLQCAGVGSRDKRNKMPISFPCMLKEEAERHCPRIRGEVDSRKGQRVRRPTSKFVHRRKENRQLEAYFHKLIILLRSRSRLHKQDLEHEKQMNARKFSMFYEEGQWPGAFNLPKLCTKGLNRGFKCFGILLSRPFTFHMSEGTATELELSRHGLQR